MTWVVWENNSTQPKLFEREQDAFNYRRRRVTEVRHQVYIARIPTIGDQSDAE